MNTSEAPLFPYTFARQHQVLALVRPDAPVKVLYTVSTSPLSLLELERVSTGPFEITCVEPDQLEQRLGEVYQASQQPGLTVMQQLDEDVDLQQLSDQLSESEDLLASEDDAPIIRLLNAIFTEALNRKASDVHIESFEQRMSVRLRIDGVLQEVLRPSRHIAPLLVSRVKVMARLDIAEKRLPQDGRLSLRMAGRSLDVRVSTIPSMHGERVVLRLLDKQSNQLSLSQLGMPADTESRLRDVLAQPNGILLVTGPTGSGKTTTLYAGLTHLNDRQRNILTVEDPVEYALDGIGQTQVNAKTGMTFARGLRAILRQDPDIVMVGEIRDAETAQIAVQASLTGHLVLSTLHTNSAVGAISRLVDIGIEPFLLAATLKGVLAQRLIRQLCPHCKCAVTLSESDAAALGAPAVARQTAFQAGGCAQCNHSGYSGRKGLYELLAITPDIRQMIHGGAAEHEIKAALFAHVNSMLDEGRALVLAGVTSVDEVVRMVKEIDGHAVV